MPKTSSIDAPEYLQQPTREWYARVMSDYALEDHHRKLLTLACEAHDRCTQARTALAEHGLTYTDRFGAPRSRPEVAIERDSRIAFARLLRELALDIEEPESPRPPVGRGNASLRLED